MREVREETGIECEVTGVIGLYSNPDHVIAYDDGEVRQELSICFRATAVKGTLRTSDESKEVCWVEAGNFAELKTHPSIQLRVSHALMSRDEVFFT